MTVSSLEEFFFLHVWTILNDLQVKNIIVYKNFPERRIHCYFPFIAITLVFSLFLFLAKKSESNEFETEFESSKIFVHRKEKKLFIWFLMIIEKMLKAYMTINNIYQWYFYLLSIES